MALPDESPAPDSRPTLGLVNELFQDARREKKRLIPSWNRYYRLLRNKSHSQYRESWLPSPSASEIYPTISSLVSWMTDQRPRSFVSASPDTLEFARPPDASLVEQLTKDMQQVLDSWWITQGMSSQTQMALWDTFTFGAGILKTGWDATLNFGQGDVVARRVDPYAILPDPAASSFDDARYVGEVRKVPMYELLSRFGDRALRIQKGRGDSEVDERPRIEHDGGMSLESLRSTGRTGDWPGTPGNVPAQFGRVAYKASDYTDTVLLKEFWIRNTRVEELPFIENGKIVQKRWEIPYWEYIAEAGGVILNEDTSNPFEHGQLPYTRIPMAEMGEFWSIPLLEHLAPAQVALNRLLAAMQLNAEIIGNPILLEPEGSNITRTKILNRPGGRIRHEPGQPPAWLTPPSMPQMVLELVGFWRDEIDRISGISAVARGSSLRRREPAQAVDSTREASFVRIRAVMRNMEEALRQVMSQTAANCTQFFIEPRTISKVGPSGDSGYLQLGNRHFHYPDVTPRGIELVPLHYDVWMEGGSSLPISREARLSEMMSLYFAGLIDPRTALTAADLPDRERAIKYAEEQAAAAAAGGGPPGHNPRNRQG